MSEIIGISGQIKSGKTTLSNYLTARTLKLHGVVEDFRVEEDGKTFVSLVDEEGDTVERPIIHFTRDPEEFHFMSYSWQFVRECPLAEVLKEFLMHTMGLPWESVHGTHEQKDADTSYVWGDMPISPNSKKLTPLNGKTKGDFVTGREMAQYWGTEIFREMDIDFHIKGCERTIEEFQPDLAIITDFRFGNEVDHFLGKEAKIVRLTRSLFESSHNSELDLNPERYEHSKFTAIIDNQKQTLKETLASFEDILVSWGY